MLLLDREDAGIRLADALSAYKEEEETIVIGLPRGGVVVAYEVARTLNLPLDVTVPRKIGAPMNPEFAIGAITETGEGIFHDTVISDLRITEDYLKEAVAHEREVAKKRLALFRKGNPPRDLRGKTVLIVDDGLATGATMQAAIASIKKEGAKKIVVAVPVAPIDTAAEIEELVDELVCLSTPAEFHAIGQFYQTFGQTSDDEVVEILSRDN